MSWFNEMERTREGFIATCPSCGRTAKVPPITPEESEHWYFRWAGKCTAAHQIKANASSVSSGDSVRTEEEADVDRIDRVFAEAFYRRVPHR